MAEGSKKRSGSFKKFFPSIFFNKSKDKNKDHGYKNSTNTPKSNQYHDPRSMIRSDKYESDDNTERIYENLTTNQHCSSDAQSIDISSNNSSSSTLVSVTVKNKQQPYKVISEQCLNPHTARPQVPPRPYYEMHSPNHSKAFEHPAEFSDVYYHSLEKLTDKISPIDEIEIYRASQIQANPASVGAEIKRVSTKFLISPKKEAEVRTIQPTRARSLSFDQNDDNVTKPQARPAQKIEKAYNYSAPTSPLPINHKIPNMPKTASPYEHVRKNMIEAEEKRNNSLSRNSFRQTTSPVLHSVVSSRTMSPSTSKESTLDREQTRKKVEAFYWQKLKEMKEKEDDYYMRHSSLQSPGHFRQATSTPTTHLIATRCTSLPRGTDLQTYVNQPIYSQFIRNAPERRTDTFIKGRRAPIEPGVVLRHPEKISAGVSTRPIQKPPTVERGSLNRQTNTLSQQKRVSFEEQLSKPKSVVSTKVTNDINKTVNKGNEWPTNTKVSEMLRGPPRPPVRTTSVSSKSLKVVNNKGIIHLAGAGHSVYSESESGSEAGEIQRILQSNAQKE